MRKIIWVIGFILCLAGIIRSNDKTEIVPYTQTSIQEFLSNPVFIPETPVLPFSLGDWTTDTFSPGDTTAECVVVNARVVRFVFRDSALAGTDTMAILLKIPGPTTDYLYPVIIVREMSQTTTTTFLASSMLIPGDNSWEGYEYIPALPTANTTFSGTFLVYRKNVNDNATPYLPKTRWAWQYE